jgi:AraC family transcriptional regulator
MEDCSDPTASPKLSADLKGRTARFKVEQSWSRGQVYGAIIHWKDAELDLLCGRREHTLIMTLNGGTDFTGAKIAGSPLYEGRNRSGHVTFLPSGAERRSWYRNADMDSIVMLVDPDFTCPMEFGPDGVDLEPFTNRRDRLVESVMWWLSREMRNAGDELPSLHAEHAAGLLMSHFMRSIHRSRFEKSVGGGLPDARLRLIFDYIEENLHCDISISQLSALAGMGPDVFARHFKARIGMPPYRYVLERRIRRAETLLAEKNRSIAEIAVAVGFSSQSHLTTQFLRFSGLTPSAYRARHRARPD